MSPAFLKAGWPGDSKPVAVVYWRGCSGKLRATRATALATRERRGSGSIYECQFCGWWHSTHAHSGRQDLAPTELIR